LFLNNDDIHTDLINKQTDEDINKFVTDSIVSYASTYREIPSQY